MACCQLFPFSMRVSQNPTRPTSNLHVRDFACFVCVVNSEGASSSSRRELQCEHASRDMDQSCQSSPQDPPSPQNAQKVSRKTYHEENASYCSIYPLYCPEAHDRSGDLSPASTRSRQRISEAVSPSPSACRCPTVYAQSYSAIPHHFVRISRARVRLFLSLHSPSRANASLLGLTSHGASPVSAVQPQRALEDKMELILLKWSGWGFGTFHSSLPSLALFFLPRMSTSLRAMKYICSSLLHTPNSALVLLTTTPATHAP